MYADTQAVRLLWQVRLPGRIKWIFVGDGHLNDPVAPWHMKDCFEKEQNERKHARKGFPSGSESLKKRMTA